MSSEIKKIQEKCRVEFRANTKKGWDIAIHDMNPTCEKTLGQVSRDLGPYAKDYLSRRITTSNPDVKSTLEKIGLVPKKLKKPTKQ